MLERLRHLESRYGKGFLLDVGAGTGSFVDAARKHGWDAIGVEMPDFTPAHKHVINVDITKNPIPGYEDARFHIIHIHHVLEHVALLSKFLNGCINHLADDGVMIVEVPNEVESLSISIKHVLGMKYQSRTAYLAHRFFFTKGFLKKLFIEKNLNIIQLVTPFTCYDSGLLHRWYDHFQSIIKMGNTTEVHLRKKISGK